MPIRRQRDEHVAEVAPLAYVLDDGTWAMTGDPVAADRAEAERAWPHYRRAAWARTHIGRLPGAAEAFDGLMTSGGDLLSETWQDESFTLAAVLEALEQDRQAVVRFRARDPEGAESIAEYLAEFLRRLDRIEAAARAVDVSARPLERVPPVMAWGRRYGDPPVFNSRGIE